ncbi:MAG: hypothetical protein CL583_13435 [Alteromonadaceae bacterium]|nr:hypothetical protein [Alteromonadaceae bacterium]|tara:strand:- start:983 stop:1180 length:198 start_codon:yes stop_codon:yes gene_type:complete
MTFDISIISPAGTIGHQFLDRDFLNASEAEAWGERQARAIGDPYDFISVRQVPAAQADDHRLVPF